MQLPQFADLADLYRGLRENIETDFSMDRFQRDLTAFRAMNVEGQIGEVVKSLGYFAHLGGHPQVAKAAVRLIAQKGAQILERNPSTLFSI